MGKTWRSEGPEQKALEKLFADKIVNGTMKPSVVQRSNELFNGFSASVFRNHWSRTCKMFEPDSELLFFCFKSSSNFNLSSFFYLKRF